MKNIKIKSNKIIKNNPIMRKETGIEYLSEIYKNDFRHPLVFDSAELKQLNIMDDFSNWIVLNECKLNYGTGKWEKSNNLYHYTMSEIYQQFLNQIKQKTK